MFSFLMVLLSSRRCLSANNNLVYGPHALQVATVTPDGSTPALGNGAADALDAFMSDVATELDNDKVWRLIEPRS